MKIMVDETYLMNLEAEKEHWRQEFKYINQTDYNLYYYKKRCEYLENFLLMLGFDLYD